MINTGVLEQLLSDLKELYNAAHMMSLGLSSDFNEAGAGCMEVIKSHIDKITDCCEQEMKFLGRPEGEEPEDG